MCEHMEKIIEIGIRGVEVLEDKDQFLKWLKSPIRALGGKEPLSLLGTREGAEMVLEILGRIEYGIYS